MEQKLKELKELALVADLFRDPDAPILRWAYETIVKLQSELPKE